MKRKLLLLIICSLFLGLSNVFAQFGAWQFTQPIAATNQTGTSQTDYQLRLVVNTQTLVTQGKMNALGNDIRFGDACGSSIYDYWIENHMNTDTTVIWVRVDSIGAAATVNFNMFYGNATAPAATNFSATFPNALITSGNTTLVPSTNYGWLQVNAGDTAFLATGVVNNFDLRVANVAGVISGNARGYQAPGTSNNGNGPGGGTWGNSSGAGAGSYGGLGGSGGYDSGDPINLAGPVYGTTTGPDIDMGSTGGSASTIVAGHGGGAIRLIAEWLTVSGAIQCNGGLAQQPGGGQGAGGGAGGGILLQGNYLNVTGTLSAKGNGGSIGTSTANDDGGGGGGGRVKVFYNSAAVYTSTPDVTGGLGGPNGNAAPGAPGSIGTMHFDTMAYASKVNVLVSPEQANSNVAPVVTAPTVGCIGANVTISLNTGFSNYAFSDGNSTLQSGSNPSYTFPITNDVTIYLTTTGACVFQDSIHITAVPNPVAGLTQQSGGPFCEGDSVQLSVTAGFPTVLWNTNATTDVIFVNMAGNYAVTVTDSNGCSATDSTVLSYLPAPAPLITQNGNLLSTGSFATYQWVLNGLAISGANSMDYLATTNGTYSVIVTDTNGCTGEAAVPLIFVGLELGNALTGVTVYPNPFKDMLQVKANLTASGNVQVAIFDLRGRQCFSSQAEFSDAAFKKEFDLSALPAGTYLLQIQSESGSAVLRLVKQ